MLCLPYFAYVFSSTKLMIKQNRTCLELRGERGVEGGGATGEK
jgi:hypothetical protein